MACKDLSISFVGKRLQGRRNDGTMERWNDETRGRKGEGATNHLFPNSQHNH
jgi:hypothetical protein